MHSVRCPCIGARIEGAGLTLVYSGDIVAFENPDAALSGRGPLHRRRLDAPGTRSCGGTRAGAFIGHTTVRAQLGWLSRYGVLRAVFSHFGKGPIEMGEEALAEALEVLAAEKPPGCSVTAAHDGLEMEIEPSPRAGRGQAPPLHAEMRHPFAARGVSARGAEEPRAAGGEACEAGQAPGRARIRASREPVRRRRRPVRELRRRGRPARAPEGDAAGPSAAARDPSVRLERASRVRVKSRTGRRSDHGVCGGRARLFRLRAPRAGPRANASRTPAARPPSSRRSRPRPGEMRGLRVTSRRAIRRSRPGTRRPGSSRSPSAAGRPRRRWGKRRGPASSRRALRGRRSSSASACAPSEVEDVLDRDVVLRSVRRRDRQRRSAPGRSSRRASSPSDRR